MENKVHYKLHKVKKQWVTLAVTSATLTVVVGAGGVVTSSVSADEVVASATTQTDSSTDSSTTSADQGTDFVTSTSSTATASETTSTSVTEAPTSSSETTSETSSTASETQGSTAISTTNVSQTVPEAAETIAKATDPSTAEVTAALTLDKIQKIDGKYYYILENGERKKNFAITVDGQLLYFNEDGALSSTSTYSFSEGTSNLVSEFTKNNAAYDSSADSFELIDGYLTADSWYRPAAILEAGKTWAKSSETDLRPLLMTWWPDKDTQVAYLNHMTKVFSNDPQSQEDTFTLETSQVMLNAAAQMIQTKIEQRIAAVQSTEWLRKEIEAFVKEQEQWNETSESPSKEHFQKGALLYVNSELTPWANSDYRLLNRTPTQPKGEVIYHTGNGDAGYEFLLSNDIDTSNPVVQAEMLNQLYYFMNWGNIVFGDDKANFDGIRVDAVDNVNVDMLQLFSSYLKKAYNVGDSEAKALANISILEAWSQNDPEYVRDHNIAALSMDNGLRLSIVHGLTRPVKDTGSGKRNSSLKNLVDGGYYGLSDRSEVTSYDQLKEASYLFVRAHDSEVQTVIADIISKKINKSTDGFTFTLKELEEAFKIYNEDMLKVDKQYTHSNIPAAYALMLQTMGAATRVYYGDLYTDNGQYMATKSPYYDQITTLLQARPKYVAGGQKSEIKYLKANVSLDDGDSATNNNGIYVSVRFGQGLMSEADTEGGEYGRNSGMLTLISNNPDLKVNEGEKLVVNMGAAHANQEYRPLLLGTDKGIVSSLNDADTNVIKRTDENGNLVFTADEIKGFKTVDMNGYLSVWVPVGATATQNVLTKASDETYSEGHQVYTSSAALEAQVIYEGFSNFQDFVKQDSQYTNKLIAENAELFKSWGITSFEIAPQYVSATDGSFLDSIIQNGYAFTDRYDLAMSQNNKYGSKEDLRNALKALHAQNIQVIADWVPDQLYQLPGKEVVTATRVSNTGETINDTTLVDKLYVANSKSSGKDFQNQYGGEFLDKLQELYPELFTEIMESSGKAIDASVKIKEWKAEYLNGTNILGRGADYVLSDGKNYFTVTKDEQYLPASLTGDQTAKTGFVKDANGITYYTTSGNQAKAQFVTFEGKRYYFNQNGYLVTGEQTIDGSAYYFLPNGVMLTNGSVTDSQGDARYYGKSGKQLVTSGWIEIPAEKVDDASDDETAVSHYRYFYEDGVMATGLSEINGKSYFFYDDGIQAKGRFVTAANGQIMYFKADSGERAFSEFVTDGKDNWYYANSRGYLTTGAQRVNGVAHYFGKDGKQVKGRFVTLPNGIINFYDSDNGALVRDKFFEKDGEWYYADARGVIATGFSRVKGQRLYFTSTGAQIKDQFFQLNGATYHTDIAGNLAFGAQVINGQHLYFDEAGKQVKGAFVKHADGSRSYYAVNTGALLVSTTFEVNGVSYKADANGIVTANRNGFFTTGNNAWYYADKDGNLLVGAQVINGQHLYFDETGKQVKGGFVTNADGSRRFYHWDTGDMMTSTFFTTGNGEWYYADTKGNIVVGEQVINGQHLYFDKTGKQVKGGFATHADGTRHFYDWNTGDMKTSTFFTTGNDEWYYADANGNIIVGEQVINGQHLFFDKTGKQVKGQFVSNEDGSISYYNPYTGNKYINSWVKLPSGQYTFFNEYGKSYVQP